MKVGNDGLLLGAWAGRDEPKRILDIGTGSGLVALMMAQRFQEATVTAVELEPAAADQARENFRCSPFSDRIELVESDFIAWSRLQQEVWDCVVCNPPFFRDKPKSPQAARNLARHDDSLPIEGLFAAVNNIADSLTRFSVVWPTERLLDLNTAAQITGWFASRTLKVYGTPQHSCERQLIEWQKIPPVHNTDSALIIEESSFEPGTVPERTNDFKELMAPFMERYA
jgi:tRNA1Val (adenine37-N6)-methyltransferase